MLLYLVENAKALFWFFIFPIVGLFLKISLSRKTIKWLIIGSTILLLPRLIGYSYTFPFFYELVIFTILACAYANYIEEYKLATTLITSGVLFFVFGFFSFFFTMAGTIVTEREWNTGKYRIDYVRDQGFAGRPLMKYELRKYGLIPFFIKKIDTEVDDDTIQNCSVIFKDSHIIFNRCDGTVIENAL